MGDCLQSPAKSPLYIPKTMQQERNPHLCINTAVLIETKCSQIPFLSGNEAAQMLNADRELF